MAKSPVDTMSLDDRNTVKLLEILTAKQAQPNILTAEEFRKYAPLYRTANQSADAVENNPTLAHLAQEFQTRIDPYKPTHVIKSVQDKTVLLRLPQTLVSLRSLSPTAQNEKAVLTNYTYRKSDLPKVWSQAQNLMTVALLQEQDTPEQISKIAQIQKDTQIILDELDIIYDHSTPRRGAGPTTSASGLMLSGDDFEDL